MRSPSEANHLVELDPTAGKALEPKDLGLIFALTAVMSLVLTLAALPVFPTWALRYGFFAALALANWMALAAILGGIVERNGMKAAVGIMAKPILLAIVVLAGIRGHVEVTSFLAAVNTFFAAIFIYLGYRGARARRLAARETVNGSN